MRHDSDSGAARTALGMACLWTGLLYAASAAPPCVQPLCVNRADDQAADPVPGTLRYAVREAPAGATITFDSALNGQVIALDTRTPGSHIQIARDVVIEGPGSNLLTISGSGATRIFLITGGVVQIRSLTLANGVARGGDGAPGGGGAGGGGGAAGMGGAIFLNGGSLVLNGVVLQNNRAVGGNGGSGGAGFAAANGGLGGGCGELGATAPSRDGSGGAGGTGENAAGQEGGWGAGGGGGALTVEAGTGTGGPGAAGGFGGGDGGAGGFLDVEGTGRGGGGGAGGAGLGGAIFVGSGFLHMAATVFLNNASAGGMGANGAPGGQAKGGALFICSSFFCGPGHNGAAMLQSEVSFRASSAADAGGNDCCSGNDDNDVCGQLSTPAPTHFSISAPPFVEPGVPFRLNVVALDANGSPVFTYAGTVHISASDRDSVLPAGVLLSGGTGTFSATLKTLGKQTITVTDTAPKPISGTSKEIVVDHLEPAPVPGIIG